MTLPRPNAIKPRLLAIDDDRFNINTLIGLLEDEYDIAVAINGQMGLQAANKLLPDLILLDITMPDMSGFEVLTALKSSEQTQDIPVVFITGLDSAEDEARGLDLGAADYISKPFKATVVKARVRTQIRLKQQAEQLASWAQLDGLTGLPNRRAFEEHAEGLVHHCRVEQQTFGLLFSDIDFFDRFADFYGMEQADQCTAAVASAMLSATEGMNPGTVARFSESAFVIATVGQSEEEIRGLAEDFRCAVVELAIENRPSPAHFGVTISCGSVLGRPGGPSRLDHFLRLAQSSMQNARSRGGNQSHLQHTGRRIFWNRANNTLGAL